MSNRISTSFSNSMYNQEMKPLDYLYGPWDSIDDLLLELHVSVEDIEPGLTIGIIEDGKVVEYWNPIEGKGFFKKVEGGIVGSFDNYKLALENAIKDNVGNVLIVENSSIDDVTKETYQSGMYIVSNVGELKLIGSDITYGEFPEGLDMSDEAYDPNIVSKDGAAKVSDVYKRLKNHMTKSNTRITPLENFKENVLSQIDEYTPHDTDSGDEHDDMRDNHMYIQRVERDESGQVIIIKRKALDTDRVLMCGDNQDDEGNIIKEGNFLTVRGTNIGNYKSGDVISNGTTLEEVLRNILDKTLYPDYTKNETPSIKVEITPDEKVYEVGSNIDFNINTEFVDGKVMTFLNDTDLESSFVDAGCSQKSDYVITMMKPTETDYSDVDFTNLVEGQYKIKVDVEYTASTTVPQTNKGEDVKELEKYIIPEGLASTEISFDVKYKMWYFVGDKSDDLLTDEVTNIDTFNDGWFNEDFNLDTITLEKDKGIYILIPDEYKVIFDTQLVKNVDAVEGGLYRHVLHNGEEKIYRLYYMLNSGIYNNIRYVKKENYTKPDEPDIPVVLPAGTVLYADFFGDFGSDTTNWNDITSNIEEYNAYKSTLTNEVENADTLWGYKDNINVQYSANDGVKIVIYNGSNSENMKGGSLWFNKGVDGEFITSDINLYGTKKMVFSWAQSTSGSSCTLYYSVDGGTNWITRDNFTQTGPTQNNNDFTCNFEVDSGVESIKIKLVHVSSNNKNTRIDALQLKVGE